MYKRQHSQPKKMRIKNGKPASKKGKGTFVTLCLLLAALLLFSSCGLEGVDEVAGATFQPRFAASAVHNL